jgi:hypothetical protein
MTMKRLIAMCVVLSACDSPLDDRQWGTDAGPSATAVPLLVPAGGGGGYVQAPTVGCYPSFGASSMVLSDGTLQWWGGVWNCPIATSIGQAIASVSVAVRDNGAANGHADAPNKVVASLILQSSAGESTLAGAASAASGAQQTITMVLPDGTNAPPHVMAPGEILVLRFSPMTLATPPAFASWPSTIGAVRVSGGGATITPAPFVAGNNNNWTPPGIAWASLIRISTVNGSPFLTGMSGGVDGRRITLALVSMVDPLTITDSNDTSSQLPNRFVLPLPSGSSWIQLTAINQAVTFEYDSAISEWRLVSKNF